MSATPERIRAAKKADYRVAPHSLDAERAVLGTFLLNDSAAAGIQTLLAPADFYDPRHQEIFRTVLELAGVLKPVDAVTLINELERKDLLKKIGGPAYVTGLEQYVISPGNVLHHARIVQEKSLLRRLIRTAAEITEEAYTESEDAQSLLEHSEQRICALLTGSDEVGARGHSSATLDAFISTPRPPLEYHIDGLLPARGKLTFSAPAKAHKTFWMLEAGICLAAGGVEWLGMRFGDPQRVLVLQPEMSDALMAARLKWIIKTAPGNIDLHRAGKNLIIAETDANRPNLATPRGRAAAERMIAKCAPAVVLCDPLYMLFPGLEENNADAMSLALDYLASLIVKYGVAIVLAHHHNKGGTAARGSSVFQGWGETDLSLTPCEPDKSIMKVDGLFRCCFGKGFPAYWQRPSEESAWFSSMPADWQPARQGGRPKKATEIHVVTALKAAAGPGLSPSALAEAVEKLAGCCDKTARTAIGDAKTAGKIILSNGVYVCA